MIIQMIYIKFTFDFANDHILSRSSVSRLDRRINRRRGSLLNTFQLLSIRSNFYPIVTRLRNIVPRRVRRMEEKFETFPIYRASHLSQIIRRRLIKLLIIN